MWATEPNQAKDLQRKHFDKKITRKNAIISRDSEIMQFTT